MIRSAHVCAVLLLLVHAVDGADLESAQRAFDVGDYGTAHRDWLALAQSGDPQAQFSLGLLYSNGLGVEPNPVEAARWFRLSARSRFPEADSIGPFLIDHKLPEPYGYEESRKESGAWGMQDPRQVWYNLGIQQTQCAGDIGSLEPAKENYRKAAREGHVHAQVNLGLLLASRSEDPKDLSDAVRWFHKAADKGDSRALYVLGLLSELGRGTDRDFRAATQWYAKAVAAGMGQAACNLGVLRAADVVPMDAANQGDAVTLFRGAADQGDLMACFNLGTLYERGLGVVADPLQAANWYRRIREEAVPTSTDKTPRPEVR
jgi:TPR repeat protein